MWGQIEVKVGDEVESVSWGDGGEWSYASRGCSSVESGVCA